MSRALHGDEPVISMDDPKCRRLEGKNVLLTAGTAGIGLAIAERMAQEGAKVFLCSRKALNVEDTVKGFKAKGLEVEGVPCHVGKPEQLNNFIQSALSFFGNDRIDVLVSNAGMNPAAGPTLDMEDAQYDKIMDTNVKSFFQLTKLARPYMSSGGSIIFVASVAGFTPSPPLGIYGVSKTAVIALGRTLSQDLGPYGIRVNTICPGVIRTKMSQLLWTGEAEKREKNSSTLQRFGDPVEISGLAAFLASDDSTYITGEAIVASGGTGSRL
mmetsp:Transcript_5841/g.10450  ORF Transcript_5841/g.10450 Transcript_5841/m.10450 type:complete len:270 (+) Transcript_5841:155-964(+)|eukprot:CAMPEP_0184528360 /NCGR_PEP_ID=MMETSP0198_2-20121128/11746_1 /TAXON_ID=1112570 /ORGANISM="Thraustochytrium sp., Strain LLF1b" /LENGTH=269 /DNA_ID=CAMNT_0026920193 /DNA_START=130 /DNA_END=939 /DNA_ORIENTATION=+